MYYNSTRFASRCVPVFYAPFNIKKLKFFMKVNAILLMIILFAVSSINASPGSAQTLSDVKVSVGMDKGTLRSAFSQIEKQTDFRFAYRNELISVFKNLSLKGELRSVKSTLDELLKGTGLSYRQLNNSIIIFKESAPVQSQISSRDIYINGRVTDENNLPLPGVSVKIKGTNKGVVTDNEGKYIIQVPNESAILVFSYIGYVTAEGTVQNGRMTNIRLKPDVGSLDAVVVIGYGTTTKRANTGSVTSITSKDIANQPVSDPIAALQGRVAGLDITGTTGYPGSSYNIKLRGINSILGRSSPLFIVDGMPFSDESLDQFTGANGTTSPLNSINPADIERIDILKDADATAIYGSRGANGVVLITTKRGKSGKVTTDARVYTGVSMVNRKVDMLNTQQYLALRREAFKNDNRTPDETNALDLTVWDQNLDQNWQEKLIGNTAKLTEGQLSLSGGSEQTNFLLSGTYRRETTVLPTNTDYNRGAFNFNVNHKSANDKFSVAASVKYIADENNSLPTDLTQYYNLAPNTPIYNPNGSFYWNGNDQNPIAYFERKYLSNTNNLLGNVVIKYNVLPNLTAQLNTGYNRMSMKQTQTLPEKSFNPANYSASMGYYGDNKVSGYNIEPQLDYSLQIGKGTLKALLGGTWQSSIKEGQNLLGEGFASDEQLSNPKAATKLTMRSFNYADYKYNSVFGRATYNWDEKYIVNGTFRRDGSSRFGSASRFGNFGAVGVAWLFSNESFIKDKLSFLSFGKLRGSYGTVGNDQIGDYQYFDSWSAASFPYAGSGTLYPSRFANNDFQWEVTRKLEGALELGFLKDRILLNASYYYNKSNNMLIYYSLSPQSGFSEFVDNLPAELENKGLELELNTVNVNRGDFRWSSALNFTVARNKLLKYPDLEKSPFTKTYFIGKPINVTTGYISTGIDPKTGLPTFQDLDGDGSASDPEDFAILGNVTPKFYGGFQNSLSYKNWSLDFFFQFVKQEGPLLNYGYTSVPYGSRVNKDVSALDRWSAVDQVTNIPIATSTTGPAYSAYNQWRISSANWGDASFIRLKNVMLKYNLSSLLKNLKLSNVSIYMQGQNLFTITNYDGFDPETKGIKLPPLSTYTVGLQVSF
ncbi:TonB-linked outer membrane protein, SusC/RagA family [Pedobacter africanus]|uniref:TonB-linked outer membrane protein, SusC/RagA family n=2 Tax=Pedobacter africanus TaxID=151894 RepID=A0A1W2BN92_9SPHI|nr:TonB-linked outer membrane protein, SusC/RagA family [Pedobacter africanus]